MRKSPVLRNPRVLQKKQKQCPRVFSPGYFLHASLANERPPFALRVCHFTCRVCYRCNRGRVFIRGAESLNPSFSRPLPPLFPTNNPFFPPTNGSFSPHLFQFSPPPPSTPPPPRLVLPPFDRFLVSLYRVRKIRFVDLENCILPFYSYLINSISLSQFFNNFF